MANPEHLKILQQGVYAWNCWRRDNPSEVPDLSNAELQNVSLGRDEANACDDPNAPDTPDGPVEEGELAWDFNFRGANFSGAVFKVHELSCVDFSQADLSNAEFSDITFNMTEFVGADCRGAWFDSSHFVNADLSRANLTRAELPGTSFWETDFVGTNLTRARLRFTSFLRVDLSRTEGLKSCKHEGPSSLDDETLFRSRGLPVEFLRGCGLSDAFIEYIPSIFWETPLLYSCFLSYSTNDQAFTDTLYANLQNAGVRCWFYTENMRIGGRIRPAIDEAIRVKDRLLLVFSENSIVSPWVEKEAETALEEERRRGQTVLFPIRLDDAVMETNEAWAADIRRTRHIGDFRRWKEHDEYRKAFDRLLRDLRAEAKAHSR